jgi:succinate-semialdehyde dehydrogenase/glutarate-semialdehyde dehydrogenase
MSRFEAINPSTGETIRTYTEMTPAEVADRITVAHRSFFDWKSTAFATRAELMHKAAAVLRDGAGDFARLMALEMGKPVGDGRAEIEKCAWACDHYAEKAEAMLAPETIAADAEKSYVAFAPLGVILAVMPWNYPFWQVFRFAAPALMAGNVAVLKHSANVSGCALAVESVLRRAGFPDGSFQALLIGAERVASLIEEPAIKAVTLTGSKPAGQAVAAAAGRMLKKTVLELGGSDPYIVLEDADLEAAAEVCAASRLLNSGQSCIAAKRFVVVASVRRSFETLLVDCMRARKMGDPMDESVEVGPQARFDLRDDLHRQVRRSVAGGARCLLGGVLPEGPGAFYPPTVLTDVRKGMPVYDEETFGPVAAVIGVKDEIEAIRVANDTAFGLGAAVFTRDIGRGERIAASQLEAGNCFVNAFVKSDPRLPFGGIKESGYGRELSHYGIKEFVNIKTVYL